MYLYSLIAFLIAVSVLCINCEENKIPTKQCPGQQIDNLEDMIQVIPCGKKHCRLQRGTNSTVYITFTPKRDMDKLTTRVFGQVFDLSLPFIGVSDQTACNHLLYKDGSPANCPLKAGTEYVYKNEFHIEKFYPQLDLVVHWALHDDEGDVFCVEVPAVLN